MHDLFFYICSGFLRAFYDQGFSEIECSFFDLVLPVFSSVFIFCFVAFIFKLVFRLFGRLGYV